MDHITEHFERLKGISKVSYLVIDKNLNIIIKSNDNELEALNKITKCKEFERIDFSSNNNPIKNINIGDILYNYSKKMDNYEYIILTGFNKNNLNQEFYYNVLPRLYEFLFLSAFSLSILYLLRKRIIKPITELAYYANQIASGKTNFKLPRQKSIEMKKLSFALLMVIRYLKKNIRYKIKLEEAKRIADLSDKERQEFIKTVNKSLEGPIDSIIYHANLLIQNQDNVLDVNIHPEKIKIYLKIIYEAGMSLKSHS
jgi:signal transduction histidine kinase